MMRAGIRACLLFIAAVAPNIGATSSLAAVSKSATSPRMSVAAPNVVVILIDDIGFADTTPFGGVAQTPELEKLAVQGLRYNNFHTAGVCSPTRAALLSGRNPHRVGFGLFPDTPGKLPGYDAIWKKSTASIAEILRQSGYSTAAVGKWHNTPLNEITPVGPFDRWPTGLGFEYFYGFMLGATSQWEPASLYRDTTPVEPRATPEQGYHLTTDLTDDAINWLRARESLAPAKPYFLYFAPGAVHFPHHVAKEWADKYIGKFDLGWDRLREETFVRQKRLGVIPADAQLTPRPKEIPAWRLLSSEERKLYARAMEVYAGFVEHTDHEIGRLIQEIQRGARGANTLIFFIVGDNGGSPGDKDLAAVHDKLKRIDELGGPRYLNGLPVGWAWAGSTPFRGVKGIASHLGALRNPLVVSWPAKLHRAGLRTQFAHVNDIAATILDATGLAFPEIVEGVKQQPMDGVSLVSTFSDPTATSGHHVQYFEIRGNRSIYEEGWIAAARHGQVGGDFAEDRWELYHVAEDYSQAHDVALKYPEKLAALRRLFDSEARRNDVYPLGAGGPWYTSPLDKGKIVYRPGFPQMVGMNAPLFSKSHRITAQLIVPEVGAEGVIVFYGSRWGGFALYARDGRVVYETKVSGKPSNVITSSIPLPRGNVSVSYEFAWEGQTNAGIRPTEIGTGRLFFDRQLVGEAKVEIADRRDDIWASFGIGRAFGSPVSDAFSLPFKFSGKLEEVMVELN